jgi:hypothetical protein
MRTCSRSAGARTSDLGEPRCGALLRSGGVEVRSVGAHGRSGSYVHDRRSGRRVSLASTEGPRLWRHETDELYGVMLTAGLEAGVAMVTGPQPPDALSADVYRRLAPTCERTGRRCWPTRRRSAARRPSRGRRAAEDQPPGGDRGGARGDERARAARCRGHRASRADGGRAPPGPRPRQRPRRRPRVRPFRVRPCIAGSSTRRRSSS